MKRISSRLTLIFKAVLVLKSSIPFIIAIVFLFSGELLGSILVFALVILFILLSKSMKNIHVEDDYIYTSGFFSKTKYKKDELKKVGYIIQGIYFLKFKSGKKVYFLGTTQDGKNAFIDWSDMGKKEIEEKIKD